MRYLGWLWYVYYREHATAGDRKEDVSASVAMVHSIPELIVSEEVHYLYFKYHKLR